MAFSTISTLSDAATITAAHLNLLGTNAEFLEGLNTGVRSPFRAILHDATVDGDGVYYRFWFRNRARYLHYSVRLLQNTHDEITIRYNTETVYSDASNKSATYTWDTSGGGFDLWSLSTVPTPGTWYECSVYLDMAAGYSGGDHWSIDYLYENGTA